ncbi:LysM peptidoglycan-binding domain-containing protein [Aerococcus urinaeequi]|uniref:Peptidoglycan hydrolase n=2 Tax=Aerococcus urinaeequi TaxID=51665 RepID=A0AAC9F3M8_9LACT|nr:LysM peptidoglycan-binding domain-containing protein [Aerococcus urinaeequi]AMB96890.1 N-acetylmuramoyl-L-alanine amidase [Aerococcus urinaeequi]
MVIEENKAVSRKSIASISKKSATLGAIVLGSAFAVSSLSANIDIPTVEASEGTTVTFASTNNAFLDSIIPDAYKLANDNDLYASVMIAQAILESNWGVSGLSAAPYYNLFGIKGTYNGEGVTFYTLEDDGSGNYYQIRDSFRDYPSYKESLTDYANKMVNGVSWDSEFYSGTWKSNTSSYKDATAALTGTYATDTRYGGKLNNLITTHGLTHYDTPAGSTSGTSASVSGATTNLSAQGTTSSTNGGKSYTVKAGDGLYTVARALGVTVAEVKAQNGLTSNLIHPGQVLSVASSSASSSSSSASTETATNTGSSATTSGKSYTVKSGDGLYSVAKALGISVSEARSLNGGSDLIHPGQVFKAATSASEEVAEETTKTGSSASTSGESYTVKSGDGLYSVAKALGISVSEARALNGGSDLIHPGKVFKAGQSTTSTSSSSSSSSSSANTGSSSASTSTGKSYTVKSGDGLYSVAKALGISVSEARALNGGSDLIHPGKVFKAGQSTTSTSSSSSSSSSSANASSSASTSGKSYTVKSGDGLYSVAKALGISVSEARSLNGGSDLIHPGKVFTAGSSSQASSSQATSSSATSTSSASTSQSSASTSGKSYTVKSGDGIYTVARALGISLAEARALNGGSDLIHPGKVFTAGSSSQASSSQATSSSATSTSSASTSQSSASTSGNSYTVKSGDGIYTVARALGISLAEARALNGGSDLIHPGKVFTTGGSSQASSSQASSSASTSSSTSTASSSATSSTKTHTVKSGETLYRIAKNNGLSLDELMTLNGLSNYNLYIGQVLKLN